MAEGGVVKESLAKQIRDWLVFAFAMVGMLLGLFNFFTNSSDRKTLRETAESDILERTSKALAEIAPEGVRSREENLIFDRTGKELKRALAADPRSNQLRRLEAERLWLSGMKQKAIKYCQKAIRDIPEDSLLYAELGFLYQRNHQLDDAIRAYKTSTEYHNDGHAMAVAYTNLGTIYYEQNNIADAFKSFKSALETGLNTASACKKLMFVITNYGNVLGNKNEVEMRCQFGGPR